MSFKITAAKTWSEREVGKKLFVQKFSIDDMSGFKVGIKFSAILAFSPFNQEDLCFLIHVVEGRELLRGNDRVQIDYLHSDAKQKLCCFEMNGGSVKNFSLPRYSSDTYRVSGYVLFFLNLTLADRNIQVKFGLKRNLES
jgi:hypothetical protein